MPDHVHTPQGHLGPKVSKNMHMTRLKDLERYRKKSVVFTRISMDYHMIPSQSLNKLPKTKKYLDPFSLIKNLPESGTPQKKHRSQNHEKNHQLPIPFPF